MRIGPNILGMITILLFWSFSQTANAAQLIEIIADHAQLKEGPSIGSRNLESIPRGRRLYASEIQKNGFLQIRTSQNLGWIRADSVTVLNGNIRSPDSLPKSYKPSGHRSGGDTHFDIKGFASFSFVSPGDVVNATGFSGFSIATGFGAEMRFRFAETWSVAVRGQTLSSGVNGRDVVTGNVYNFSLSSLSAELGLGYRIFSNSLFNFTISGYGGLFFPQLQATATNLSSPNLTTYIPNSSLSIRGVAEMQMNITARWNLFLEGGYWYAKSATAAPGAKGNGSNIFLNSQGSYSSIALDVGGIFVDGGVSVHF